MQDDNGGELGIRDGTDNSLETKFRLLDILGEERTPCTPPWMIVNLRSRARSEEHTMLDWHLSSRKLLVLLSSCCHATNVPELSRKFPAVTSRRDYQRDWPLCQTKQAGGTLLTGTTSHVGKALGTHV